MAVGVAPFGEMPPLEEILRRVRDLAIEPDEHVPDQHVVSQVVLKQFTEPWGKKGELLLASLNGRHPERPVARGGPAKFGKWLDYVRFASGSAERLWQQTETKLHEPLEAIKRCGCVADQAQERVVRDAIALHVVRSIQTTALHQTSWLRFRQATKQFWLQRPGDLEQLNVDRTRYWTADPVRLERTLDAYMREREAIITSGALFRVSLEDRLERLQAGFQAFDFKILSSADKEFLIGDAPVLLMREGHGGLGFFDGVGVGNADEIVMPLTPHHVAVLGQGTEHREATDAEIDRFNTLQVRIAYHYVYFRPGSDLASFVRSMLGTKAA